jgi:hypothetical protein
MTGLRTASQVCGVTRKQQLQHQQPWRQQQLLQLWVHHHHQQQQQQ